MNPHQRLVDLKRSLAAYDVNDVVPTEIAKIFNVLLEEAKKVAGDDPVLAQVDPVDIPQGESYANCNVGAMQTMTQQLITAVRKN